MTQSREPIHDADQLLRRVPDNPDHWERTSDGMLRVRSAAFQRSPRDGGVSVSVRRLLDEPAAPESALGDRSSHGLIEFAARLPRTFGLDVLHAPEPDHWAHANIVGFPEGKKERNRIRLELAKAQTVWVRHPDGA